MIGTSKHQGTTRGPKSLAPSINARGCATQAAWPKPNGRLSSRTCQPPNCWNRPARSRRWRSSMRYSISPGWVVNGGCCRAIFRTTRRCSLTSMLGVMTGRWSGSISSCCCRRARRPVRGQPVGRGDRQPVSQNHRERTAERRNCPRARQSCDPGGRRQKVKSLPQRRLGVANVIS
jgi:hypothetical protein